MSLYRDAHKFVYNRVLYNIEFIRNNDFRMTEELIRKHCKEKNLYLTPYLNDVLYLHYKGIHNNRSYITSQEH